MFAKIWSHPTCYADKILLLVMLDNRGIAGFGLLRVQAEFAAGAALAQQIPALIEMYFKLVHSRLLVFIQSSLGLGLPHQRVFLVYQTADCMHNVLVSHGVLSFTLCDYSRLSRC